MSDAVPALISYLTPEGRYRFCNRAYTDWFGLTSEAVVGRHVSEVVGLEMWRASEPKFRQALAGEALEYEVEANYRHGPRRWVRVSYTPHHLADGTVCGVVAMIFDITQRKNAEQAARAAEDRMQLAMAIADAGTWDLDLVTQRLYWSDSHFRILGCEPMPNGEASMEMWQSRLHAEDADALYAEWKRAERDGDTFHSEHRLLAADGKPIWVRAAGRFTYDENGRAVRFVGVFFDISAAKETEKRLEQLVRERTEELRVKLSELEAFSFSLSHDLRAPLRSMHGFAQILLEDHAGELGVDAKDYLRRIERGAHRLDQLVRDVLAYSKVAKAEFTLEPVDLSHVVADAVHALDADATRVTLQNPLPVVLGHGALLSQIFSNLLGNAVKFARPGQRPVVQVHARTEGDFVRVYVEDEGIGIAPQHFTRIFEIFWRIHGPNEYPGTGIGLAIARKAAERMGGSIGVESEVGRGSRFWVNLRLSPG